MERGGIIRNKRGHYCWVCQAYRPNEQFSGKGHARHICRGCQRLPGSEIEQIRLIDHMSGFLRQSVISQKNIDLLVKLTSDSRSEVQSRAKVMLEVARFRPGKRRRLRLLALQRPELLQEVLRLFDVPDYYYDPEGMPDNFLEEDERDLMMDGESATDTEMQLCSCETDGEIPF